MAQRSRFNRYCLKHGGRDEIKFDQKYNRTPERRRFNAMYSTQHWQTLRQVQLSTHPLCAGCQSRGIVTPGRVVDHVFPWSHFGEHAFFDNLFQTLCDACHAEKGRLEGQGIFRRFGTTVRDYVQADYVSAVGRVRET